MTTTLRTSLPPTQPPVRNTGLRANMVTIMRTSSKMSFAAAAALVALTGCMGAPDEVGRSGTGLDLAVVALPTIDHGVWIELDAGCEGRIQVGQRFGVAGGELSLLVALDDQGDAVCVDTFESMLEEVETVASPEHARRLEQSYLALLENEAMFLSTSVTSAGSSSIASTSVGQADPSPQPNLVAMPAGGEAAGDPSPQPNDPTSDPTEGDPSPQPNQPMGPAMATATSVQAPTSTTSMQTVNTTSTSTSDRSGTNSGSGSGTR